MNIFRNYWLKISSQISKHRCNFEKQMLPHHIYCFTGKTIFQKTNLSEVWRTPSNGGNFLRVTKEYPWRKAGLRNLKNSIEKQVYNQKPHSLIHITKKRPRSPPVKHVNSFHLSFMRWINQMLSACHYKATSDRALRISSCFISRCEAAGQHWDHRLITLRCTDLPGNTCSVPATHRISASRAVSPKHKHFTILSTSTCSR